MEDEDDDDAYFDMENNSIPFGEEGHGTIISVSC
jgi:hypothetical protein